MDSDNSSTFTGVSREAQTEAQDDGSPIPDRSIVYTIDALLMALLLIAGLGIAFQLAPSEAGISADLQEKQIQAEAGDILDISQADGSLVNATVYWDDAQGRWVNSGPSEQYVTVPDTHPINNHLDVLEERGFGYSLTVEYLTNSGFTDRVTLAHQGTPGSHAVATSRSITLHDNQSLFGPDDDMTVSGSSSFYAPDAFDETSTYNIVTIHLVIWRV